jgi:peptidoglycan/LPS O-acetylase OafA/YrhL
VTVVLDRPSAPAASPSVRATTKPSRSGLLPHFPALDGLRGLAVVGVVAFHAQLPGSNGGFLGVSTFFTLSGFLITSLLLTERRATTGIDIRQFWKARFRRLMPASLAALSLAVLFGVMAADAVQRRNLAGDVIASLAYVANWRFLLAQQSYADIFGQASPVAHFWSLAIEEQFYVLYPLMAWWLLVRRRVGRGLFAAVLGVLAAASVGLGLSGLLSPDAIYYSTPTRAAELLAGALLAVAMFDRRVTIPLATNRTVQRVVGGAGLAALVACLFLWVVTEQSGDRSPWLYKGGLPAYSLLTMAVILAAVTPWGPVKSILATPALRRLGLLSYGIYLYHWPVFVWLDPHHVALPGPALLGLRLAVTALLAVVSFHFLETPIRRRRGLAGRMPVWPFAPPVIAGLAVAVIAVSATAPPPIVDFEAAASQLSSGHSGGPASAPDTRAKEPPFPRIAFYGDSTALMTGTGVARWAQATHRADTADGVPRLGCGIGRGGERKDESGKAYKVDDRCNRWELDFRQSIETDEPNLAVVQIGPWEVADRRLEGSSRWVTFGDPEYDAFMLDEMQRAVDVLSSHGAVVVWLTSPIIGPDGTTDATTARGPAADPRRMNRLNELIRQLPAKRPGKVELVDLAGWLSGTGEDRRLRPDGIHFSAATGTEVAERFLADALTSTFKRAWTTRAEQMGDTAADGPAPTPTDDKYLTTKYRALVIGDHTAGVLAGGLQTWGSRTGVLDVDTQTADCGILQNVERRLPGGTAAPPVSACQSSIFGVLQKAVATKPDFVLVAPSAWDLADLKLTADSPAVSWGDPAFDSTAATQYLKLVAALNKIGAVVIFVNPPVADIAGTGPDASARWLGGGTRDRARRYDEVIRNVVAMTPKKGAQVLDMAHWAAKSLPFLANGGNLSAEERAALGEWTAKQAYVQYDNGDKLKLVPGR